MDILNDQRHNHLWPNTRLIISPVQDTFLRTSLPKSKTGLSMEMQKGLAWSIYSSTLYDALRQQVVYPCRGEQARREIVCYFKQLAIPDYGAAYATEIAHSTQHRIEQHLGNCQNPLLFIAFAHQQFIAAIQAIIRGSVSCVAPPPAEYKLYAEQKMRAYADISLAQIRQGTQQIITNHQWKLISVETLTYLTLASLIASEKRPSKNAIMNIYIPLWYQACLQLEYVTTRNQAYRELDRFVRHSLLKMQSSRLKPYEADIVQDTLRLVIHQIDKVQSPETFLGFVKWKLRDRTTSWQNTAIISEKGNDDMDIILELPDSEPGPIETNEQKERDRCLMEALGRLAKKHRNLAQVVLLRGVMGMSIKETANRLNIEEGSVSSNFRRGKKKLSQDKELRRCLGLISD